MLEDKFKLIELFLAGEETLAVINYLSEEITPEVISKWIAHKVKNHNMSFDEYYGLLRIPANKAEQFEIFCESVSKLWNDCTLSKNYNLKCYGGRVFCIEDNDDDTQIEWEYNGDTVVPNKIKINEEAATNIGELLLEIKNLCIIDYILTTTNNHRSRELYENIKKFNNMLIEGLSKSKPLIREIFTDRLHKKVYNYIASGEKFPYVVEPNGNPSIITSFMITEYKKGKYNVNIQELDNHYYMPYFSLTAGQIYDLFPQIINSYTDILS